MANVTPSRDITRLIEIMAALRTASTGCPWDLAQNFSTIAPYTIEEAYEGADAIERRDFDDLRDELGDLLLQVVFYTRMAMEAGHFGGVPVALPALTRALKLQEKAGKVGFDWNDPLAVLAKIREEADEIAAELASGAAGAAREEVGDLLFAVVNLARHLGADPEAALRATNEKFERRFGYIEETLATAGKTPEQSTLAEMDELWNEAKQREG